MSKNIQWNKDHTITVDPPKRPKKITGTRFAAIAGLNKWTTPFATWCEITKTYQEPFEDTIYTIAGKTIEPKQADYMESSFFMKLTRPADIYGEDYFKTTFGDFFKDDPMLGGMWDYLLTDEQGKVKAVLEMKTTKRAEDWVTDIPEYYARQAALYAYLLGVDQVYMVCSILDPKDYEHPEEFVPSVSNTIVKPFKVSERYPNMAELVQDARDWWNEYVVKGISPEYDDKADADILKALRTNAPDTTDDIEAILEECDKLKTDVDAAMKNLKDAQDRLKACQDAIKAYAIEQFRDGDNKVTLSGKRFSWTVSKSITSTIDKKALESDGLLDKYTTQSEQYKLTSAKI